MSYVERRSIEELAAIYELEPTIRDVIVEGADDAALVEWYVKHRCECEFSITEINAIHVPSELLDKFDTLSGNQGRVVALATYLDKMLDNSSRDCVTLVVDADYDRIAGISWDIEFLLTTDYTCLEMYLFDEDVFDKLISVVLGGATVIAINGLSALASVLQRLWVCKVANHLLGFSMSWTNFLRDCRISGEFIEFNESGFINRYLTANGRKCDEDKFMQKCDELTGKLEEDLRHGMDGHHFMELARWYLRNYASDRKPLTDQRTFERAYFGCIELSKLDECELFKTIALRIRVA